MFKVCSGTANSLRKYVSLDQIIIDELMHEYFMKSVNTYIKEPNLTKISKLTQKDKLSQRGKSIYGPQRKY